MRFGEFMAGAFGLPIVALIGILWALGFEQEADALEDWWLSL